MTNAGNREIEAEPRRVFFRVTRLGVPMSHRTEESEPPPFNLNATLSTNRKGMKMARIVPCLTAIVRWVAGKSCVVRLMAIILSFGAPIPRSVALKAPYLGVLT